MKPILKVVIVMSRCYHTRQAFGIRLEEKLKGQWIADWAFEVKEIYAKKEGHDRRTITGAFALDPAYPGCSYCQAKSIFKCGCGKANCWNGKTNTVTCSWYDQAGELGRQIEALGAGEDY